MCARNDGAENKPAGCRDICADKTWRGTSDTTLTRRTHIGGNLVKKGKGDSGEAMNHDHGIMVYKAGPQLGNALPGSGGRLSKLLTSLQPYTPSLTSIF